MSCVGSEFDQLKVMCRANVQNLIRNGPLYAPAFNYIRRLESELKVYDASGYSSIILIISDYNRWARDNGVVVGPGRGSAAGSLVVYLAGITSIDPLRFGLLFERFLNPERISQPDIDTDFSNRDAVIDYLREQYGPNRVAKVGVPSLFKPRSAIDEMARVHGLSFDDAKRITKCIGDAPTFEIAFSQAPELVDYESRNPVIFQLARAVQGYVRQITTHPSAVILTGGPIGTEIPLQKPPGAGKTGELTTGWDGEDLDNIGHVKLDILTIDNLGIIDRTIKMLPEDEQKKIDFYNLPLDDYETLAGFGNGETVGVFQFEEPKSVGILQALDNVTFNDVCAVNALIRPGLDVKQFVMARNDAAQIRYIIPQLEPILKETYGVILYQEQVMRMCVDLAGFTMGGADKFRKIMAKTANQRVDFSPEDKEKFRSGYEANGLDITRFEDLWAQILACQNYIFNKSHAVCYGYIAYADMYLKRHYPLEFMCAALQTRSKELYVKECGRLGITVLPPSVQLSASAYMIEGKSIRMGLSCIKHVGAKAKTIISRRPYTDEFDFLERGKPNENQLTSLSYAGALDCFEDRARIISYMVKGNTHEEVGLGELAMGELEALGFYLATDPLGDFTERLSGGITPLGRQHLYGDIGGLVSRIKLHEARTGTMAFGSILTVDGELDFVVWPSDWAIESSKVKIGNIIKAAGKRTDRGGYSLSSIQVLKKS